MMLSLLTMEVDITLLWVGGALNSIQKSCLIMLHALVEFFLNALHALW